MKAVTWQGVHKVHTENVPDPILLNPHDAIVRVTAATICGSDLHLYDGYIPSMMPGDIIGHEFMGEVIETGPEVKNVHTGDRVVVPSVIACGHCRYCKEGLYSHCDNSNPNARLAEMVYNQSPAGFYGYSHAFGGYAGAFAEYTRIPYADVGLYKVPDGVSDEQALFASDGLPTGYQAAQYCDITPEKTIAVWGAGAVGQFAILSAYLMGAKRVIAIDRYPDRLEIAERVGGAETLNYEETKVVDALTEMTGGYGPDACIDAVGMEAMDIGLEGAYDRVKQGARLTFDRIHAVREAILACRKGGIVSIAGVYGGLVDKFPLGAAFNKGLTLRLGQVHAQRYLPELMDHIQQGRIDPSFAVTHRLPLDQAALAFEMFRKKEDGCMRVVFQ
jgi:threonine dehydrogenase-like Zn-dependent dehydrogenase